MSDGNHSDEDEFFDTYDNEDQLRQRANSLRKNQFQSSSLQSKSDSQNGTPDKVDLKEKSFTLTTDEIVKSEDSEVIKKDDVNEGDLDPPTKKLDFETIQGTSLVLKPKSVVEDNNSAGDNESQDATQDEKEEPRGESNTGEGLSKIERRGTRITSAIQSRTDDSLDGSMNSSFASNNTSFVGNPQLSMSASSFSHDRHMSDFCHTNGVEGEYFSTPSRKNPSSISGGSRRTSDFDMKDISAMPEFYSQGHSRTTPVPSRSTPTSGATSRSDEDSFGFDRKSSASKLNREQVQISKAKESWLTNGRVEAEEKAQVKSHHKQPLEFDGLTKVQTIQGGKCSPVWAVKFSPDGTMLATGDKNGTLLIYKVSLQDPNLLLERQAYRQFNRHTLDIVDLCWTLDNRYVLTASLDHNVILHDVHHPEIKRTFSHNEMVTCIAINPTMPSMFVTGSFDKMVRVWDLNAENVQEWSVVKDLITAVAFSPDGESILLGLYHGQVLILELRDKMKYKTTLDCRNRSGKFKNGRKVTSIDFIGTSEILVVTNDSRLRVFDIEENAVRMKYKGKKFANEKFHIRGSVSWSFQHIICASEDGTIYIWNKSNDYVPSINPKYTRHNKEKNDCYEFFRTFKDSTPTFASFAPVLVLEAVKQKYKETNPNVGIDDIIIVSNIHGDLVVYYNKFIV